MKIPRMNLEKYLFKVCTLSIMTVMSLTSVLFVFAGSKKVDIYCDGKNYRINTSLNTTESIMNHAKIRVGKDDVLIREDLVDQNCIRITVKRAFDIPIIADGIRLNVKLAEGNVRDAIERAGILVGPNDLVTPGFDQNIFNGISIDVTRRRKIKFIFEGNKTEVYSKPDTVEGFLNVRNIKLDSNYALNVNLADELTDDMEIILDKVNLREETIEEIIPFEIERRYDNNLSKGKFRVITPGKNGIREVDVSKKILNGEVVQTDRLREHIKRDPVKEVRIEGTKEDGAYTGDVYVGNGGEKLFDTNGNEIAYSKRLYGSCTAYSAEAGSHTSTGESVHVGCIAVNPNIIPYGSRLLVCSNDGSFKYYGTASDTGGALMNGSAIADLFFWSEDECNQFGRRNLNVFVLS